MTAAAAGGARSSPQRPARTRARQPPSQDGSAAVERFDRRLAFLRWRGRVEQVFGHAALARGEVPPRVTLLSAGRPLVPWSVEWTRPLRVGDLVDVSGGVVRVVRDGADPVARPLAGAGTDLAVPVPADAARAPLRLALPPLPAPVRRLLGGGRAAPGLEGVIERRVVKGLQALVALARSGDLSPAFWRRAVDDLAGLGSGSTPTGDDVLVGFACGLRLLAARGLVAPGALAALAEAFADVPAGATTETSREMLGEAAAGFFAQPLVLLAQGVSASSPPLVGDALRRASSLGARSGHDMLAGALALLQAFAAEEAAAGGRRA